MLQARCIQIKPSVNIWIQWSKLGNKRRLCFWSKAKPSRKHAPFRVHILTSNDRNNRHGDWGNRYPCYFKSFKTSVINGIEFNKLYCNDTVKRFLRDARSASKPSQTLINKKVPQALIWTSITYQVIQKLAFVKVDASLEIESCSTLSHLCKPCL